MMYRKTVFEDEHPLVLFIYLTGVIILCMFTDNYVINGLSLFGSLLFLCLIEDKHSFIKRNIYSLILIIIVAATNPLFSHNGATPIVFVNGLAYTKEAFIYGIHLGLMICSVINWFSVFGILVDNDKLMYLIGRFAQRLALLLSMAFRFIPMLRKKFNEMKDAQKSLNDNGKMSLLTYLGLFLAVAGWAFEKMPGIATSMNARGYGTNRRTTYSIFRFTITDGLKVGTLLLVFIAYILVNRFGVISGYYYPVVTPARGALVAVSYALTGVLFCFPFVREGVDRIIWNSLKSKI